MNKGRARREEGPSEALAQTDRTRQAGILGRQRWQAEKAGRVGRQRWQAERAGRDGRQRWQAE